MVSFVLSSFNTLFICTRKTLPTLFRQAKLSNHFCSQVMSFPKETTTNMSRNRTEFSARDIVADIWETLDLPKDALSSLNLTGSGLGLPSSFKIGPFAQASISLSALAASLVHAQRNNNIKIPKVTVPLNHAVVEFKSERLYLLNGRREPDPQSAIGGLFETSDGWVRIHDSFTNHRLGAFALLGLAEETSRKDVAESIKEWKAVDLETKASERKIVIAALRSFEEWDALPQAQAVSNVPIRIRKIGESTFIPTKPRSGNTKCLQGLRVLEFSRVIAAPLAGRTLAAHGADILWVTSPHLPDLPLLDVDLSRGKRTIQLDLHSAADKAKCLELIRTADVLIQGYRPDSLSALGLSPAELVKENSNLIFANLSAYGSEGPWNKNRGFDSLVQTCSGINISEAEHFGDGSPVKSLPCQALDHASGYFLATGIIAALHKREKEGGSFVVDVSLAGTGKYLRSLGQYAGNSGFDCEDYKKHVDAIEFMETRMTGFGKLSAVTHSAKIEGVEIGWDEMSKPLGSDKAVWL